MQPDACALTRCSRPWLGYELKISERGYFPRIDDEELQMVLFRSQEIRWAKGRQGLGQALILKLGGQKGVWVYVERPYSEASCALECQGLG